MKSDHICFTIFLFLLFIAPEIPLSFIHISGPALSSISIAFLGLIFWLIVNPKPIKVLKKRASLGFLVVSFAIYAFLISIMSDNLVSILYSLQYLFYALFGFLVLRTYLIKSSISEELNNTFGIFIVIGLIFSLGIIISVIIGPIYPHQTLWTARIMEDTIIQRGVGFTENPNAAGGLQIIFLAASIFLYPSHWRYKPIALAVMAIGLFVTFSRSALISFFAAGFALVFFSLLHTMHTGKVCRQVAHYLATCAILACIFLLIGFIIIICSAPDAFKSIIMSTILFGLGISSDYSSIGKDTYTRLQLWQSGINNWINQGDLEAFFGIGFHNSNIINEYGVFSTPHNLYINVLSDFGIVGLFLIIFALLGPIINAMSKFYTNPRASRLYSFSLLSITALGIHNMTEIFLYSPKYVIMLLFSIFIIEIKYYRCARENVQ